MNNELFGVLRSLSKDIAQEEDVPPYVVFGDNSFKEMSARFPRNSEELFDISGVGESKCEKYGERFLDIINDYVMKTILMLNGFLLKNQKPLLRLLLQKKKIQIARKSRIM